jgi:hypothetical protein
MFGQSAGWMQAGGIILRYEHGVWIPIAVPAVFTFVRLLAFSAVSPDEAWTVGMNRGTGGKFTTIFAHYINGAWDLWPQTFPGGDQNLTMLSPSDGWSFNYDGSTLRPLHYDGSAWTQVTVPQGIELLRVYAISSDVTWFEVNPRGPHLEQYSGGAWQQVDWPFSTVDPLVFRPVSGTGSELWGVGDIIHSEGCPNLAGQVVYQGVFLHFEREQWTEQVLP